MLHLPRGNLRKLALQAAFDSYRAVGGRLLTRSFSSKPVPPVPFTIFGGDSMMMVTPHLAEVVNNGLEVQVVKPGNVTFYFMKRTSPEDKTAPDAKRYDKNTLVSQTLRTGEIGELIRNACEDVKIKDKWQPQNSLSIEKGMSETHENEEVRKFTINKAVIPSLHGWNLILDTAE